MSKKKKDIPNLEPIPPIQNASKDKTPPSPPIKTKRRKKKKGQTRRGDPRGETKYCGNKH